MTLPRDYDIGQAVIEAIIEGGLLEVDRESMLDHLAGRTDGVLFGWSANADEQIGQAVLTVFKETLGCQ